MNKVPTEYMRVCDLLPNQIIQTIRQDAVVGRGNQSVFDEAYTDEELLEYVLKFYSNRTLKGMIRCLESDAIDWAQEHMPSWVAAHAYRKIYTYPSEEVID